MDRTQTVQVTTKVLIDVILYREWIASDMRSSTLFRVERSGYLVTCPGLPAIRSSDLFFHWGGEFCFTFSHLDDGGT